VRLGLARYSPFDWELTILSQPDYIFVILAKAKVLTDHREGGQQEDRVTNRCFDRTFLIAFPPQLEAFWIL
jgi:hypothetical protein